jgi:hypothetical protein
MQDIPAKYKYAEEGFPTTELIAYYLQNEYK